MYCTDRWSRHDWTKRSMKCQCFMVKLGTEMGLVEKGVIPPDSHLHWVIAVKNTWDFWGSPRFGLGFHWSLDTRYTRSMFCQLPSPGRPMSRARRWENGVGSNIPKDPQLLGALKYLTISYFPLGSRSWTFFALKPASTSGSAVDCHDLPWQAQDTGLGLKMPETIEPPGMVPLAKAAWDGELTTCRAPNLGFHHENMGKNAGKIGISPRKVVFHHAKLGLILWLMIAKLCYGGHNFYGLWQLS